MAAENTPEKWDKLPASPEEAVEYIGELREIIDELDDGILAYSIVIEGIVALRTIVTDQIGSIKRAYDLPVKDAEREAAQDERVIKACEERDIPYERPLEIAQSIRRQSVLRQQGQR
jgi:chorismate mutase